MRLISMCIPAGCFEDYNLFVLKGLLVSDDVNGMDLESSFLHEICVHHGEKLVDRKWQACIHDP